MIDDVSLIDLYRDLRDEGVPLDVCVEIINKITGEIDNARYERSKNNIKVPESN